MWGEGINPLATRHGPARTEMLIEVVCQRLNAADLHIENAQLLYAFAQ